MKNEKLQKRIYNINEILIISLLLYFGYRASQTSDQVSMTIWLISAFMYMLLSNIWYKLYEIHRDMNKTKEMHNENEEK